MKLADTHAAPTPPRYAARAAASLTLIAWVGCTRPVAPPEAPSPVVQPSSGGDAARPPVAGQTAASAPQPAASTRPAPATEGAPLDLTIVIVREGIGIRTRAGDVAPGCRDLGAGLTLPSQSAGYDYDGLRACARALKDACSTCLQERGVTIVASRQIPYQVISGVARALRSDEKGELFPEVTLKPGKP